MLACPGVTAWGPVTQKYICSEAVGFVWGVEVVEECLPVDDRAFLTEFCQSVYNVMGEEYEEKCLKAVEEGDVIHPALASYNVFGDKNNHHDYSVCPVHKGSARDWVCGDGSRPAYEMAHKWFAEAESASDKCMRVYQFCVAASYYSDAGSKLRQIRYVENDCVGSIEASIDRSIENGLTDWSSNMLCRFDNGNRGTNHRDYQQRMGESSSTIYRIITELTQTGAKLREMPYTPRRGVVVLANSIDYALASEFLEYLKGNGVKVIHSNASEFKRLRYNEHVILLGGQNSPEGVGEVVGGVLSTGQEDSLLVAAAAHMFVEDGVWQTKQKVIVLAGNEASDTRQACSVNKEKVLALVAAD